MAIIKEEVLAHQDFLDNRTEEEIEEGKEPVNVRVIKVDDYALRLKAWILRKR